MTDLEGGNPQQFHGFRNLDCPRYLNCLDYVVSMSWNTFSCRHCLNQNLRQRLRAENMDMETTGWEEIWAQTGWMTR